MGLEGDLRVLAVKGNGLGDIACPCRAVAHLRAAQRVEIVERAGAVFRHPQRPVLGQPRVHFGGRFRTRRELELQLHTVDRQLFAGLRDFIAGRHERDRSGGLSHADALRQLAGHAGGQKDAILIIAAAAHTLTGVDIFLHGVLREAHRRDHWDLAAGELIFNRKCLVCLILLRHHAGDAAKMVGVGMRDDDGLDREFTKILFDQLHGSLAALHAHQRVKDDPAGIALDNGEVCHVIAADLIDAIRHFKKTIGMVVLRVLPEAGIYAVRRFFIIVQERIGFLTPEDRSILVL